MPSLWEVINSIKDLVLVYDELKNLLSTLYRVLISISIALVVAIPLGLIFGTFRYLYNVISWLIDFFKSIPVSAMFPLFLIFFGFGDTSKIAMGVWASGLTILVATIHGVSNVKKQRKIMALTKNVSQFQILTKINFFESLPYIFTGIRIAVSWNLIVIVVAEMFIGTRYGLGHYIYEASILFATETVLAGVIIIGGIGYIMNYCILKLESKVIHWTGV